MKIKKSLLAFVCAALLISGSSLSAQAATATLIMDNDAPSSSGTTNPWSDGESYGGYNMPTYLKSSNYYNGDVGEARQTHTIQGLAFMGCVMLGSIVC